MQLSRRPWMAVLLAALAACSRVTTGVDAFPADGVITPDAWGEASLPDARTADRLDSGGDGVVQTADTRATDRDVGESDNAPGVVDGRGIEVSGSADGGVADVGPTWHLDPAQPLATTACPFSPRSHPLAPTALWADSLTSPRPTNAFWMNLVLDKGDQRINLMPYHVKALATGLAVAFPSLVVADASITTPDAPQWILGSVEPAGSHQVTAYDDLSVTVTWNASSGTSKAPLVYGMPYASLLYHGTTPSLQTGDGVAITGVNGTATPGSVMAQTLTVTLNNGQTWKIYAPSALRWTWSSSAIRGADVLEGWVRIAYQATSAASGVLDQFADAIPTGGSIDLSTLGDVGLVRFDWQRTGSGDLLMMAMPHHWARLQSAKTAAMSLPSLSGALSAVAGDSWTLAYPLSTITWTAPRAVDASLQAEIQAALREEASFAPSEGADPYFGGKQLAKLARLVLMARESGVASTSMIANLRAAIVPWLDGTNANPLVYDKTWGGLVTSKGIADPAADFGQGYYNDHHFHYGYHVYAAAVLAREDATWAASYADKVLCLVRDFANPSRVDPGFPRARNFDWFVGHSWAAGLFAFGDSRNQESTSEAVNAWYAVELFGRARGHQTLTNLGRILRAMEGASAQTYWQVADASTIYQAPFRNHHAVGILWGTKVDFTTFFGNRPEYVYGIQMIPFTPASEDLLAPAWVADASTQLSAAGAAATEQGWKGFMTMAKAVVDPAGALAEARALTGYDDGNSKANTLYWIATRPK